MPKKENTTAKPQKFFFDVNDFNDDVEEEIIEDLPPPPPPPPTFSEEELAAARSEGYNQGKRDGLAEAQASREKFTSGILETISKNFATLFQSETERAQRYETEAVHLSAAIFKTLFPALNAHHGVEEVRRVILHTLERYPDKTSIIIEVHPDYVDDITMHLQSLVSVLHGAGDFTVRGNPALGPSDCRLQWAQGGAGRNAAALAGKIEKELSQLLAGRAILHDNEPDSDTERLFNDIENTAEGDTP